MLINPQKWTSFVKQGSSNLVATSRGWLRRFDPNAPTATDLNSFDGRSFDGALDAHRVDPDRDQPLRFGMVGPGAYGGNCGCIWSA